MPKYLVSTFFAFIFCANTIAQKVFYSTNVNSGSSSINNTSDRGYLVFGWVINYPLYYNSISKLDRKGNLIWEKYFLSNDSLFSQNEFSVSPFKNGFLIPMYYISNGGMISADSFLLANINQDGNVIWEKNMLNIDYADKNFYAETNNTISKIRIDNNLKTWFEKTDTIGNTIYSKPIINLSVYRARFLKKTTFNTYVFNTIDTYITKARNRKSTIVCIDTTGNILWDKILNYSDTICPTVTEIIANNENIYALICFQDSATNKVKFTIYKFDFNGSIIDIKELIGSDNYLGYRCDLIQSIDNGFYCFTNLSDSINTHSQLFKLDKNLNIKWSFTFNNPILCIDTGNCNSIVIAFVNNRGYTSTIESIKDPELDEVCDKCDNTVFPNPTAETFFNIKSNLPDVFIDNVEVFDYAGKSVWNSFNSINSNYFTLINNLSDGIYICRIGCDNGKQQTKKVVIAK